MTTLHDMKRYKGRVESVGGFNRGSNRNDMVHHIKD